MSKCFICGIELTEDNCSVEHIIPNAIGGRLKSKDLICKLCNSKYGENSDAMLAKQMNPIMLLLNAKRERGNIQPILIKDKESNSLLFPDGHIEKMGIKEVEVVSHDENGIVLKAKDMKSLKKYIKRKFPDVDVEEVIKNAKFELKYEEPTTMEISICMGGEARQSILKTAIEFFLLKRLPNHDIKEAIEDLKLTNNDRVELFVGQGVTLKYPSESGIYHSILLCCDSFSHKAYVIVEYFGLCQFLVKLTDHYSGTQFNCMYSGSITEDENQKELNCESPIPFEYAFNFEYPTSNINFKEPQMNAERLMHFASNDNNSGLSKMQAISRRNIIDQAWSETIDKMIPEGEAVSEDATKQFIYRFSELVAKSFFPTPDEKRKGEVQ